MANRPLLIRAFVRAAILQSQSTSSTPRAILEAIVLGKFTSEGTDGKTLIKTSGQGVDVEFAIPGGLGVADVMEIAEEALEWVERQPDPDNPVLPTRKIRRLRVNFGNA